MAKAIVVNLIIDQGNSSSKLALFDARNLLCYEERCVKDLSNHILRLTSIYPIERVIYSSVLPPEQCQAFYSFLQERFSTALFLDHTTLLPITLGYRTPETLGRDRIAAVVGAVAQKPGEACLVIDAGTAVTYDFVSAEGCFVGGNIAPGLQARFEILHRSTGQLPLVSPHGDDPLLGYDTQTAIRSGVLHGLLYEMEHYITQFRARYPGIFVFLTGGDSKYFAAKLKSSIFADRILVQKGLNHILNNHVERYPEQDTHTRGNASSERGLKED